MPWYLLTRQQQLSYAHLLNRLQNGSTLRMGPFAVLNRETLSIVMLICQNILHFILLKKKIVSFQMTNRIYSVLMLLVRSMGWEKNIQILETTTKAELPIKFISKYHLSSTGYSFIIGNFYTKKKRYHCHVWSRFKFKNCKNHHIT